MARKPKLTPELIAQIETALQGHSTVVATCDMMGITEESFYRWKREGEAASSGIKREFYETVKRAQGMSRVLLTSKIAADPSWQAKAWLLERMYPKEYGRRQLIAHAGADGESDLPTATTPVNLTINYQGTDKTDKAPWIHRDGVDPEPQNGSDPWEQDPVRWEEMQPGGSLMPMPGETTPPPTGWPEGKILPDRTSPLDTGGRSRDPDEP
jgi:transposase